MAAIADSSVKIPEHASQILQAQATSLTEKRNRDEGAENKTPKFNTDKEAKDYIQHWHDQFYPEKNEA